MPRINGLISEAVDKFYLLDTWGLLEMERPSKPSHHIPWVHVMDVSSHGLPHFTANNVFRGHRCGLDKSAARSRDFELIKFPVHRRIRTIPRVSELPARHKRMTIIGVWNDDAFPSYLRHFFYTMQLDADFWIFYDQSPGEKREPLSGLCKSGGEHNLGRKYQS